MLLHAERNGYVYVLDRTSGEVLSANPFHFITAYRGVDLRTGRLQPVEGKRPKSGKVVRMICPSAPGAKDWQPTAWSPRTALLYIPHQNLCMDFEGTEANYISGTPYIGATVKYYGPLAVLAGLQVAYAFADRACSTGDMLPVHLTALAALLITLVAGVLGWREWRSRFLALLGLLTSAMAALLIVAQWSANLFFHPCQ